MRGIAMLAGRYAWQLGFYSCQSFGTYRNKIYRVEMRSARWIRHSRSIWCMY